VRTDESWRAAVESCAVEAGDDEELDIDTLRRQVNGMGDGMSRMGGTGWDEQDEY